MDQRHHQHVLALKVPPVAVVAFMAAVMWIVSFAAPFFAIAIPVQNLCAIVLMLAGAMISALGVVKFRRAKTTVNPMKPESTAVLVDSGIYRLTRNPMYLGFLLALLGWAVFMSNILAFLLLPVFIFYMNFFQIEPEEKALAALFGPSFDAYMARVRRWL